MCQVDDPRSWYKPQEHEQGNSPAGPVHTFAKHLKLSSPACPVHSSVGAFAKHLKHHILPSLRQGSIVEQEAVGHAVLRHRRDRCKRGGGKPL
eukprot:1159660-Pelagomonas_calceolata.AAC.15